MSATVDTGAGRNASRRSSVRLLGISPAALLLSGLFAVWAGPLAAPAAAAGGDWTQFRNSATHEGYNATETILSASTVPHLALAWKGAVNPSDPNPSYRIMDTSPAVANGVVYVGSRNSGKLFAYAVGCGTGGTICTPLWTALTDNWWIGSSPAVYTSGSSSQVFVTGSNGSLYAFDANGNTNCSGNPKTCTALWTANIGGSNNVVSPTVHNGVVYVASTTGLVYAFDPTTCGSSGASCTPLWTSALTGSVFHSSPAVAVVSGGYYDGQALAYVGADDGRLYVYSATGTTGCSGGICSPLWASTASGAISSSPAVSDGKVYVGSGDGRMRAFDAKGWLNCSGIPWTCVAIWTAGLGGASIDSSPAVVNGVVYYGIGSDLQALDYSSSGSWHATTGAHVNSSPAVANGVVYDGSQDGKLYAYAVGCNIDDGVCSPIWTYTTGGAIHSSPAVANGVVYVGSDDGYLYAFALPLDHIVLSPADATVAAGVHQAYTAEGFDAYGTSLGDVTAGTTFTTSGFGTCAGASCWATSPGTVSVTGSNGSAHDMALLHVTPTSGATYHAITPTRVLDTRNGTGGLSGPFTNHTARTFTVGGVPAGATAVTGNLTVTGQTSSGYLFIGPVAANDPGSSTLNFPVGDDRANAVTVALGAGGTLSITFVAPSNGPSAHAIFDVTGYFTPDVTGATYHALSPTRALDTRNGTGGLAGPFTNHAARTFTVGGVPSGATAVTGNLTVTGQTSSGYLFIGPVAANNPGSSTLNFPVGDDRANAVTVALGAGGTLAITFVAPSNGPTANAIFDVTGYFTGDMSGAAYHPLTPTRILDTRNGTGGLSGPFGNHAARAFGVTGGSSGVPADATAVTGNLTVTGQTSSGYLYIGPVAANDPSSSTLNFPVGDDRANAVTVALGGGSLSITFVAPAPGPTAHAIFDVTGYFTP